MRLTKTLTSDIDTVKFFLAVGGHLTCQVTRAHPTDLLHPQSSLHDDEAGVHETEDGLCFLKISCGVCELHLQLLNSSHPFAPSWNLKVFFSFWNLADQS